jgi:Protein of unknown function (DUF1588)/Protein of unknown function (DUF1592)/Protein of unknown function (DUF1595)/Protein of unknown function (DUF1587)
MTPLCSSFRASRLQLAIACAALGSSALGCSAAGGGPETSGAEPVAPTGAGASGGGGGIATGGTEGQVPPDGNVQQPAKPGNATSLCAASEPGAPALRRLSRRELENSLRDIFPVLGASWRSGLSADTVAASGFDNDNTQLLVSKQTVSELADTAEGIGTAVAGGLAQVLPCAASAPDAGCAGQFLDSVGRRLFRRPLSDAERTAYLGFFDTALTATGDFPQAIGWLTRGLIESPSFVYRREVGSASGQLQQLDQYEIASELAFTFSGSGPSVELLDQASRGELGSPEVLTQTARALLDTPSGHELIQTFFDAYVGHSKVTGISKAGVQEFAGLREQMLEETRHFIEEVVINEGGGPKQLLTANITTPTGALSTFYGFDAPASDYAIVERPAGKGIGLLAQGAVLATLSQPNGSSPTKRGLWIYKRLLCNTVPQVPPNIPELKPPQPGARTTRQRYELDHAQGSCQGCHSQWDPIGFGFEHFDEAGRYRELDGNLPIDTASHVNQQGVELFQYDGEEDLMTQLVEQPIVSQCMSGYLTTFAFGEALSCAGEGQRQAFIQGEIGVVDYLASLAGEPRFTQRVLAP